MGGRRPFHDLSAGETAVPPIGREMWSPAYISGTQISRRNDPAYLGRESLGAEEKTSRTRDIHSKAFTPGLRPGVLCRFLIGNNKDRIDLVISDIIMQVVERSCYEGNISKS